MKKIILLAALTLSASSAMAMSRYDTHNMTCSALHNKIAQEGEIVLRYPSHSVNNLMMYDRYVSNSAACVNHGTFSSATVPTSDEPSCKVQRCVSTTGKGHNRK
ncbi:MULTISPECIES: hypothetical protein [Rhizobium]|uniref:Periplasmic protein n=1 Tax=Rhizobium paranaense TaxID=1650438 RepID=A0A7W9D489_9HYPH|nr:hypothetical protein [Rhizobium paranaense]MBB5576696.1 hypothetical protein [Rhizobium paranaense]